MLKFVAELITAYSGYKERRVHSAIQLDWRPSDEARCLWGEMGQGSGRVGDQDTVLWVHGCLCGRGSKCITIMNTTGHTRWEKSSQTPETHQLSTCYEQLRAISIIAGEVIFKSQSNGHRGRESLWTGVHLSVCLSVLALRCTIQFTHRTRAATITSIEGTTWSFWPLDVLQSNAFTSGSAFCLFEDAQAPVGQHGWHNAQSCCRFHAVLLWVTFGSGRNKAILYLQN